MNKLLVYSKNNKYYLSFENKTYQCILGRAGLINFKYKIEGDGATPQGKWSINDVWHRPDKISKFICRLPIKNIIENDGWCDDPKSPDYNKHIKLPYKYKHEKLFRNDSLYDILITLGYNESPTIKGKGSAIFIHCREKNKNFTEGCIGLWKSEIIEILENLDVNCHLIIK